MLSGAEDLHSYYVFSDILLGSTDCEKISQATGKDNSINWRPTANKVSAVIHTFLLKHIHTHTHTNTENRKTSKKLNKQQTGIKILKLSCYCVLIIAFVI